MLKKDKGHRKSVFLYVCSCGEEQIDRIIVTRPDMVLDFRSKTYGERQVSHALYGHANSRCSDKKSHTESPGVELIKSTHLEHEMMSHKSWNFPAKIMTLAIVPIFGADFLPFTDTIEGIIGITAGIGLSSFYVGKKTKQLNQEAKAIKKTGSSHVILENAYLSTLSHLSEIELYEYSLVVSELDQVKTRIQKGEEIMDTLSDDNPLVNELIEELSQLELDAKRLEDDVDSFDEHALNNREDELSQNAIEFLTNDPRYKNMEA